jgi:hypothetical protein
VKKEHCDNKTEQKNFGLQRAVWMEREIVVWGKNEVWSSVTREQSR